MGTHHRYRLPAALAAALLALPLLGSSTAQGAAAPTAAPVKGDLDLATSKVQWIDRTTLAWPAGLGEAAAPHRLVHDPDGRLRLQDGKLTGGGEDLRLKRAPGGLTRAQRAEYPHLAKSYTAYRVEPHDRGGIRAALRGQVVAVAAKSGQGRQLSAATGVQIPGVLDDLYATGGHGDRGADRARLGPVFAPGGGDRTTLSVWAPTARRVAVEIGGRTVPMRRGADDGVWRATGDWKGASYRYRVTVFAPSVQRTVTNKVTDPYSTALTADSERSVAADLDDAGLKPAGWDRMRKPDATPLRDAQIQELHVRDFSVSDPTSGHPGKYRAFTDARSDGMRHLRQLAAAGASYVHLLPAFDFATVPEREDGRREPGCDLPSYAPDSRQQQKCVGKTAAKDAFNWGYDPQHYTVPEGSYASDPEGPVRTREFREMVRGLNGSGLRTVMDVVYNHTAASGQDPDSVLDRIVPGYYHRLLADGSVADSTCCANTAPEHAMMGKLTVDSVVTWAKEYKVDGFRFDLMGHHPRANILAVREALDDLTPAEDGVDGKDIVLYGEGWNFGEVADDARFVQATQRNMAGAGVATFSDRARDAVRGGAPFDQDPRVQGFGTGLYTDPNSSEANGSRKEQRARLLHYQDLLKVGLSGGLADYAFTDSRGRRTTGAGIDYNGAPAGYAAVPGDALSYADAHDNETLHDALTFKLPQRTTAADRARMQVLSLATATLSQGPALSQAGSDLLRSKSLDRNSFDSGDWFNVLNWDCRRGNGFGRGLPPGADNEDKWPVAARLLADPRLEPGCEEIEATGAAYRDLLRLRAGEQAFSKPDAAAVQKSLDFPLSGKDETPGVVTARLDGLMLVFNATPERREQQVPGAAGERYGLHEVQARGADPVVKRSSYDRGSGTFSVPARTVAVFSSR